MNEKKHEATSHNEVMNLEATLYNHYAPYLSNQETSTGLNTAS